MRREKGYFIFLTSGSFSDLSLDWSADPHEQKSAFRWSSSQASKLSVPKVSYLGLERDYIHTQSKLALQVQCRVYCYTKEMLRKYSACCNAGSTLPNLSHGSKNSTTD